MVPFEGVDAAVPVHFFAGDAESKAADGFDGADFGGAVANGDDLFAAKIMFGHELAEDSLFGEFWIVIDGAENSQAEMLINF